MRCGREARGAYPSGVRPEPKARTGTRIVRYDAIAGTGEYARLNEAIEAAKLQGADRGGIPARRCRQGARARRRPGTYWGRSCCGSDELARGTISRYPAGAAPPSRRAPLDECGQRLLHRRIQGGG